METDTNNILEKFY